jgi:hypothetical protein
VKPTSVLRSIWNNCDNIWTPDTGAVMKSLTFFLILILLAASAALSAPSVPSKMRPYTGIGVLILPADGDDPVEPLPLYDEPGLSRLGSLNQGTIPRYEWIFGATTAASPLVVTGRKGSWLRVAYDDAGREAWLNPVRPDAFQPWDFFLKDQVSRMLPGLQKKYYQLFQFPDKAVLAPLTSMQFLKVLRLENDWAMVLSEQNLLGWLRWRDEDGRLLIGISSTPQVMSP